MNEQNLRTPTSEEARAMQRKGAEKRKENNAKNKDYKTSHTNTRLISFGTGLSKRTVFSVTG